MIDWSRVAPVGVSEYSQQTQAERLIAAGRVVLTLAALLAVWLDPSEPGRYTRIIYVLVSAYLVYALLLGLLVWRSPLPAGWLGLTTHALDIAVFSFLMQFSRGPASPFFAFLVFSLLCATLRWHWRGVLWNALIILALFAGMGVYASDLFRDPEFELNSFMTHAVSLGVMAVFLGYLAYYEQRRRSEIARLAAWPHASAGQLGALIREILEHAVAILPAPCVILAWEDPEEPWHHLAWWSGGEFQCAREPLGRFEPLVAEPLASADFLCQDARAPAPRVLYRSAAGFQHWGGVPVHPNFRARFGLHSVLGLRVRGEGLDGRLFFLDRRRLTVDDLVLGKLVAGQAAARLALFGLVQRLKQMAVSEERVLLARDVHDGALQSMTAAAWQLQTVRRLVREDPRAAEQRLEEIQQMIAEEQRNLRFFVEELKPAPPLSPGASGGLATCLEGVAKRVERHWGLRVELNVRQLPPQIPESLVHQIPRILREALVNAAKHARASAVRVELGAQNGSIHMRVADNGRGFPFRGLYDHATLIRSRLGPASLVERIEPLGGSLAIESADSGACLEIRLPLAQPGAHDGH
ncbi:MAG: sensor histidine kinase [Chloroflexi bacterium]|nr:sensor histidine kinase [Chloroflexota bacterium]